VVVVDGIVASAIGGAASGAASDAVLLLNAKFYTWWAEEKSVGKNSSADNSNLDSSNDSDAASIENQQTMVKIVQFFSRELEKVHHDHAAVVATLNASNDAANAAIGAKDVQINTLINSHTALINSHAALITNNSALNAALISNNTALNAALISNNTALIDIVKNNRPGWFRRATTGNARAPVGTTENPAEDT
jgi:hypothetical protein